MQVLRSLTSKDMIHHQTGCSQPAYIYGSTSFSVEQSLLTEIFRQQLFLFFGTLLQEWSEIAMEYLMQEILLFLYVICFGIVELYSVFPT